MHPGPASWGWQVAQGGTKGQFVGGGSGHPAALAHPDGAGEGSRTRSGLREAAGENINQWCYHGDHHAELPARGRAGRAGALPAAHGARAGVTIFTPVVE